MQNRRFMRLTNRFSKNLENHAYSGALFAMFNDFCRIHKTLRVTPGMEAGAVERDGAEARSDSIPADRFFKPDDQDDVVAGVGDFKPAVIWPSSSEHPS
jgi:hypothetical protein